MRSIMSMFSKSPFRPLVSHIEKVRACVDQMNPLFSALEGHDYQAVMEISEVIIKFEHEADNIKDQIRQSIGQSVFFAVDKRDFMQLLSAQDDIADAVEDLAVLLRIKNLETPEVIREPLMDLVDHIIKTANQACDLICELDTLLEASGFPPLHMFPTYRSGSRVRWWYAPYCVCILSEIENAYRPLGSESCSHSVALSGCWQIMTTSAASDRGPHYW